MLVDPIVLLAFIPAALALNLTPGADMIFCLGQGLHHGPRAAIAADCGIAAGALVQVLLAGLGLGAVVATLPWLFDVIRWIGVFYLLWLAWSALQTRPLAGREQVGSGHAFRDAFIVNLTNPKVILFVLAFIPQFIDPSKGAVLAQFLIFGLVLSIGGLIINGSVGIFEGSIGRRLARSAGFARILGYVSAGVFATLAVRLAVLERS